MEQNIESKMRALVDKLNAYNKSYYVENKSRISDYEFDMMMKDLQEMERTSGVILPDSPTQKVGSDLSDGSGFKEFKHQIPMGSIENCYDYDSIISYFEKIYDKIKNDYEFRRCQTAGVPFLCIEPKFDGLSCALVYRYGKLESGSTRGDGNIGADITANIKYVDGVLEFVKEWENLPYIEVRGEVLMPKSVFNRLNEKRANNGQTQFANERNAASGSLKQLDPKVTAERHLRFIAYNILFENNDAEMMYLSSGRDPRGISNHNPYQHPYYTQYDFVHDQLRKCGFNHCPETGEIDVPVRTCGLDRNFIIGILEEFKNEIMPNSDFAMDGVVIKLNSKYFQTYFGYKKKCPDWCRAMKWKADSVKKRTKLIDVEWTVGKTGKLTPTAVFEPVNINGSTISRATLNNPDYILKYDLHYGDYVTVERAGEVIPFISGGAFMGSEPRGESKVLIPTVCPSCGSILYHKTNITGEDSSDLYCENHECPAQLKEKLIYYCSKPCMDIDGFGKKTIDQMFGKILHSWKDLYDLTPEVLEGFGYTAYSARKMTDSISAAVRSKKATPDALLFSTGINGVGKRLTTRIMSLFNNDLSELLNAYKETDFAFMNNLISEVGPVAAGRFYDWMKNEGGVDVINFYLNYSNPDYPDRKFNTGSTIKSKDNLETPGKSLNGKTFLATGTLSGFTREGIKEEVENHGGTWASGVSKNLDYLIVGEKAGSKLEKAKKLNVSVLTEQEFLNMIK